MARGDDPPFRPRPSKPRGDGRRLTKAPRRFTSQVLRTVQANGGGVATRFGGKRKGAEKGRGWVAARLLGDRIGARSRRVVMKARLVVLAKASPGSAAHHLAYIQRDGVTPEGRPGQAYSKSSDIADADGFVERSAGDRHQFRFIVSAEDAAELGDLKAFTRDLMGRMEADLGTRLDWVAVDHFDTDNPHTHVVLRGVDQSGGDLVIARDYIAHGLRLRASLLATERLGPQTERELRERMAREVGQERWTGLDRRLVDIQATRGRIDLQLDTASPDQRSNRDLLVGRLRTLERLGLAEAHGDGGWRLRHDAERVLRDLGERNDIVRRMQRAFSGQARAFEVFDAGASRGQIVGRIARKGLADELEDRGYVVVDGVDGRARYIALPPGSDLPELPVNGVVAVAAAPAGPRASDRAIAAVAEGGVYRPDRHRDLAQAQGDSRGDPDGFVAAHVRRLEALRRAGIVERIDDNRWRIPQDFLDQAAAHEAGRFGGVRVEVLSHLPIERQVRAIGATWLDRSLVEGAEPTKLGFGGEVASALDKRRAFLRQEGLADRDGRLRPDRNLLEALRRREIERVAGAIARETGLEHRPVAEGDAVRGTYRRSLQLVSGRFAMVDDGLGFSLVPWRPVLEQRLGQALSGVMKGGGISWSFGRGPGV